ncbi:hypothetical protein LRS12_17640 [Sphingomonas sp. J344]|uniref:hypothetical protein n=1 Tax=Sphingomonas sp. J344 TaxID=2898434 RepID=UPI002150D496|nr:hypothetical protein [Sphingomonas sp. J344]MCR5872369.1 hypothetical protein [Sphingomonas sp. J344]
MVATMPASVFVKNRPWRTGVAGTVWNGEVGVSGGSKFEWHWAPLRSLTSLGFAADWTATGPDTDMGGRALAGFSSTVLDKVSGSSHAALLQALQPNLPFTCDMVMQLEFDRIAVGGSSQGIDGRLTTDAGTCTPKGGGAAVPVPPLLLTSEKIGTTTQIRLTPPHPASPDPDDRDAQRGRPAHDPHDARRRAHPALRRATRRGEHRRGALSAPPPQSVMLNSFQHPPCH